jgi:hypothetical protein
VKPEWGWQKATLLFCGLVCKGIAFSTAPEIPSWLKAWANVLWLAFDGSFVYLLQPPKQNQGDDAGEV